MPLSTAVRLRPVLILFLALLLVSLFAAYGRAQEKTESASGEGSAQQPPTAEPATPSASDHERTDEIRTPVAPPKKAAAYLRLAETVVAAEGESVPQALVGIEYRDVFAPVPAMYSGLAEAAVSPDGTLALGALIDLEALPADAEGVAVAIRQGESYTFRYFACGTPDERAALAGQSVTVADAAGAVVQASARPFRATGYTTPRLALPEAARLDVGLGYVFSDLEREAQPWRFTIEAITEDGRIRLLDQIVEPAIGKGPAAQNWRDVSLPLGELSGKSVAFAFDARPAVEGDAIARAACSAMPVWGNPLVLPTSLPQTARGPNVILISLDTLRADYLHCYGYPKESSPNIDRFAQGALLFEQCISSSSWTLPAHASMMTGLHPFVHKAGLLQPGNTQFPLRPLAYGHLTLAEILQASGYVTAAFTEGRMISGKVGMAQGFGEYSDGIPNMVDTVGCAQTWLERHRHLPFFLFVHSYEPHWPYGGNADEATKARFLSETSAKMNTDLRKDTPFRALSDEDVTLFKELYAAGIAHTDHILGGFLDAIAHSGLLENTLIIITSDHGEEFLEHSFILHGLSLYKESLHVPYIVRMPGGNPPSGRINSLVSTVDTFATVLKAAGVDMPMPRGSLELLSAATSKEVAFPRDAVVSHLDQLYPCSKEVPSARRRIESQALTTSNFKYIEKEQVEYRIPPEDRDKVTMLTGSVYELYDRTTDVAELTDLASSLKDETDTHRETLKQIMESLVSDPFFSQAYSADDVRLTDEEIADLKAIGYL